jgi:hypothetical protein
MRSKLIVALIAIIIAFTVDGSLNYTPPITHINFMKTAPPMYLSLYSREPMHLWAECATVEYLYSIPTDLLKALIVWESGGNLYCVSFNKRSWDGGPVQLNNMNLKQFATLYNGGNRIDPFSTDSVRIGGKLLADLYKRHGSWRKAIQHYDYHAKDYADLVFRVYIHLKGVD